MECWTSQVLFKWSHCRERRSIYRNNMEPQHHLSIGSQKPKWTYNMVLLLSLLLNGFLLLHGPSHNDNRKGRMLRSENQFIQSGYVCPLVAEKLWIDMFLKFKSLASQFLSLIRVHWAKIKLLHWIILQIWSLATPLIWMNLHDYFVQVSTLHFMLYSFAN